MNAAQLQRLLGRDLYKRMVTAGMKIDFLPEEIIRFGVRRFCREVEKTGCLTLSAPEQPRRAKR